MSWSVLYSGLVVCGELAWLVYLGVELAPRVSNLIRAGKAPRLRKLLPATLTSLFRAKGSPR